MKIGNLFYGTKGWLWIEEAGKTWQSYFGPKNEKGPGAGRRPDAEPTGLTTTEYPHYQNFIDAIRAGDPKLLTCDVLEGHLSSTLPHLGNISYRVGRQLQFDGKTETFVNDKQADRAADARVPERVRAPELVHVEKPYQQPSDRHRRLRAWPQRGHRRADAFCLCSQSAAPSPFPF